MSALLNEISWLDVLFVILLLGMVYKGARTGVGGQLLSLAGWFLLLFASLNYYNTFSSAIFGFLLQKWARPLSFFAISALVFIGIKIAERIFNVISGEELASIERIGGAIVAFFRACILFGLIGILCLIIPVDFLQVAVMEKSKTGKFFVNLDVRIYSSMTGRLKLSKKRTKNKIINEILYYSRYR